MEVIQLLIHLLHGFSYRNLFSAPSEFNSYAGSIFPSLTDALYRINESPEPVARWDLVKKYMSIITYTIKSAAASLRPVTEFSQQ